MEVSLVVHYPKNNHYFCESVNSKIYSFECYKPELLVMINMQEQLGLEVCTHKIKIIEWIISKSLLSKSLVIALYIIAYLAIVYIDAYIYVFICMCLCTHLYFCVSVHVYTCVLELFNFPLAHIVCTSVHLHLHILSE